MRKVFAIIEVDDDKAIKENKGTGEYLEQEFGWLNQSGIELKDWLISDFDDEKWSCYINYLIEWSFDHHGDFNKYLSPVSYDEWCDTEE